MNPVRYARVDDVAAASMTLLAAPGATFIAGGTNVVDLMKDDVARPSVLVDITALPLANITATAGGGVRIGALATMAEVADALPVRTGFPVVSQARRQRAAADAVFVFPRRLAAVQQAATGPRLLGDRR
jgi:xanthine dehydrogenase YagS FAD-binding subunit